MKASICIPVYNMKNARMFLKRALDSVLNQTFKDYEIVISDDSSNDDLKDFLKSYPIKYFKNPMPKGMATNSNHAMNMAIGDLVKVLYMDDYFYNDSSLGNMVDSFTPSFNWLATGCIHTADGVNLLDYHEPFYSHSENTIGSPSVTMFRREVRERFDLKFSWVLDLDLYRRIHKKYGKPKILKDINIVIGLGEHQMTNILSNEHKNLEFQQLNKKYDKCSEARL